MIGRLLRLVKVAAIAFSLCIVIAILLIVTIVYVKDGPRPEWHDALNKVHDQIQVGMTRSDVGRIIDSTTWPPGATPIISRSVTIRRWTIQSPFEFPASNWILFIDFSDSVVFRVGMGTLDSLDYHPRGARPMKVDAHVAALEASHEARLRAHEVLKRDVVRMIRYNRPITEVRLTVPHIASVDSSTMTASCVVTYVQGKSPSDSDIQAIRRLIVNAFPPLLDARLVLTDGSGRPLNVK